MKKIIFSIFIIMSSMIYSFEYKAEFELRQRLREPNLIEDEKLLLKSSLDISNDYKDIYLNLSLKSYSDNMDEIQIFRAFGEYYGEKYNVSLGKQRIVWGSAYIYNLMDLFNDIEIEEPKRERKGVKALRLNYNFENTSKAEFIYYKNSLKEKNYLAFRYFSTYKTFEYAINYLEDEKGLVLETKGDILLGVWTQLALETKEYLLGMDYSFDIFYNNFYTVYEMMFREEEKVLGNYFRYNYNVNDTMSFGQSFSKDSNGENGFFNIFYEYLYSDNISIDIRLNRYLEYNEKTYSELDMGINLVF